jgi:hypothetical protein
VSVFVDDGADDGATVMLFSFQCILVCPPF